MYPVDVSKDVNVLFRLDNIDKPTYVSAYERVFEYLFNHTDQKLISKKLLTKQARIDLINELFLELEKNLTIETIVNSRALKKLVKYQPNKILYLKFIDTCLKDNFYSIVGPIEEDQILNWSKKYFIAVSDEALLNEFNFLNEDTSQIKQSLNALLQELPESIRLSKLPHIDEKIIEKSPHGEVTSFYIINYTNHTIDINPKFYPEISGEIPVKKSDFQSLDFSSQENLLLFYEDCAWIHMYQGK